MLEGFADPLSTRLAHSHFASTTIGIGTRIVWVTCCPEETNAFSCDQPCVDVLADIRSLLRPMHIAMGGVHDAAQVSSRLRPTDRFYDLGAQAARDPTESGSKTISA